MSPCHPGSGAGPQGRVFDRTNWLGVENNLLCIVNSVFQKVGVLINKRFTDEGRSPLKVFLHYILWGLSFLLSTLFSISGI